MPIEISDTLSFIAAEAAAQRMAWLGTSGSGKSYGCGRYVEQLYAAQIPVVVVDTVGIWPAIRLAADGKKPGLPFVIIGGEHADVPLDIAGGQKLARFLVSENASSVIDLSDYAPEYRAPFVADLCETVLIAIKTARRPRVFVFDEAQDTVPQTPAKGESRMRTSVSALIRKGRNHLCGTVLLSQRPQDVSKAALNQIGNLFVGALFGKHERDAVRDWAGSKARSKVVDAQIKELPELQPGEFFFWSPQWLKVYQRVRVLPKWTYDGSSSTPLTNAAQLDVLAPVDVKALRALLTPEPVAPSQAAAAAARRGARSAPTATATGRGPVDPKGRGNVEPTGRRNVEPTGRHDVEGVDRRLAQRIDELKQTLESTRQELVLTHSRLSTAHAALELIAQALYRSGLGERGGKLIERAKPTLTQAEADTLAMRSPRPSPPPPGLEVKGPRLKGGQLVRDPNDGRDVVGANGEGSTYGYRMDLLATLVTYGPGVDRSKLSLLSGKSKTSTAFARGIRSLVHDGLALELHGKLSATPAGVKQSPGKPLPRGRALFDHWKGKMTAYDATTFDTLAGSTRGLTRAALSKATGHSLTSTAFARSIRRLKTMGLAHEDTTTREIMLLDDVRDSMDLA